MFYSTFQFDSAMRPYGLNRSPQNGPFPYKSWRVCIFHNQKMLFYLIATMGNPKSRSRFFNLPNSSRHFGIGQARLPPRFFLKCRDKSRWPSQFFKKFEVSREKSGLSPIFLDFPQFPLIFPNFTRFFFWPKMAGKIEENSGTLPDPDLDLSKNWGGLPDLDLDPTWFLSRYYPPRDISPMVA